MSSNGTRMIQFGVFEVDLHAGDLRRNGSRVKLQEQPFQILTLLLERPGEVVTREELQGRLWPADTFVDFDHSLNAAVRRLRDALGDSAENPRFVETVARRGYRFLAPVNGTPAVAVEIQVHPSRPARIWWIALAGVVLLVAGLGAGVFLGRRGSRPAPASPPVVERRLTANPSEYPISSAALSSDGKYLAFSDDTGSYLRQVDTGETHPLALPQGFRARPVGWFPDGSHILATSACGTVTGAGFVADFRPGREPAQTGRPGAGSGGLARRYADRVSERNLREPGSVGDGSGRRAAPKSCGPDRRSLPFPILVPGRPADRISAGRVSRGNLRNTTSD